ncbi:hypothetical protein QWY93_03815 [Echinicola jeungdonensis]|uniref:Lipoprotein n=1 Tax=Echinicola jeungdonensis TaxID=709343 RepID=A0ABV5J276_9BACT|nr:hypothetical protein [Echinicola jeungdonensis]MDN3668453.1 hypothetical protein [Echinicola jeungdonensis]
MNFIVNFLVKLSFLISLIPFQVSEEIFDRYHIRVNPQVQDSLYTGPVQKGLVQDKAINEASGLSKSQLDPGVLYTHNDSGGDPVIYRMDTTGKKLNPIYLKGVKNRDWEDMAIGPGPKKGKSYVYVGEIGDNKAQYPSIQLLRFEEPKGKNKHEIKPQVINLKYPDGPRDAETLLVDPLGGDVFILSKRDSSNTLYKAPASKLSDSEIVLEKVMKLPVTMSVGGDISVDGSKILIKNYWAVYYWERKPGESIPEALSRIPVQLPYSPEPQGEAISFSGDGLSYFTLSEKRYGVEPVLYRYYKKE